MLAAVVILALAVMWFEGRMLAANLAHEKSLGSGTDWTAAVTAAERAAALAPRNPIYQMTAGELLVSAGSGKRSVAGELPLPVGRGLGSGGTAGQRGFTGVAARGGVESDEGAVSGDPAAGRGKPLDNRLTVC